MTDAMGQRIGNLGDNDLNDWQYDEVWNEKEYALLDFKDTLLLTNTKKAEVSVGVYPNPNSDFFSFYFHASNKVKFKMVLVNESFEVLEQFSTIGEHYAFHLDVDNFFLINGYKVLKAQNFGPNVIHTDQYADGEILRLYYSFSAEGSPNFYKGHGDILICRSELEYCY